MNENELIKCPYCEVSRKRLVWHLKSSHNKSKSEVLEEFPDFKFIADAEYKKFSKAAKVMLSNPDNIAKLKIAGRNNLIKFNKTQWTEDQIKKSSEMHKKLWQSDEYRSKWHRTRSLPENLNRVAMNKFKKKMYPNGEFRSSYESKCAELLTLLNYTWQYESFYVRYSYEGKNYSYSVDFYLPDYNLILEVKPKKFTKLPKNQAKRNGSISLGYRYLFVTEDELWGDINKFDSYIKSSTTIESIAK